LNASAKRLFDTIIGAATPFVAVAGILIGLWQFNVGEQHRADIEFHRQLFLARLSTYQSIAAISGEIAAATDRKRIRRLAASFDARYWGLMVLVEDKGVATAMREFHEELHDYLYEPAWTNDERLKQKALAVAQACRASIENRREADL
jgi:hypothetical protein